MLSWVDSVWLPALSSGNVLDYFAERSNPFYDRSCNNELLRMQRRPLEHLVYVQTYRNTLQTYRNTLQCIEIHYNRIEIHYNRIEIHYNHIEIHYNRIEIHYNRIEIHYNRIEIHYNVYIQFR